MKTQCINLETEGAGLVRQTNNSPTSVKLYLGVTLIMKTSKNMKNVVLCVVNNV